MAEYKHGRIYVKREDTERLTEQVWVFDRAPEGYSNVGLTTPMRLRFYGTRTRPSRRHSYTGKEGKGWGADTPPRERHLDMPIADVPLPDDVRDEALSLARDLVTLAELA
jgi:hypothetical protein